MLKLVFILLFSLTNFAYATQYTACLSHGDCQEAHPPEDSRKCLKVFTGTDALGNSSCAIRCYEVKQAYQCVKFDESLALGACVKERFKTPMMDDQTNPDCSDALRFPWD